MCVDIHRYIYIFFIDLFINILFIYKLYLHFFIYREYIYILFICRKIKNLKGSPDVQSNLEEKANESQIALLTERTLLIDLDIFFHVFHFLYSSLNHRDVLNVIPMPAIQVK